MQCHDDNSSGDKKHSPLKHMLMMILCCGLPILLVMFLPAIISVFPAAAVLSGVIPFLCPILMGLMMFTMMRGNGHAGCGAGETQKPAGRDSGLDRLKE